jgi:hypothetical protein
MEEWSMSFIGHIKNGVVVFDTPVTLPEGSEVRVELSVGSIASTEELPPLYESIKHLIGQAKGLPPDMSINHDHYLYGTPKQQP